MPAAHTPVEAASPAASSPATTPGGQTLLAVLVVVALALLIYRGYGHHLTAARPTEPLALARIDLNTADEKELAQVPGLGPKLAENIVAHRRQHGVFQSVEQLQDVRGIGPLIFEKVRYHVTVGTHQVPTASAAKPAASQQGGAAALPRPRASGVKKIQPGEPPINVNSASADELQRLPGIGPVMAQNIITARTIQPFEQVDDLDRVKGIGPKTLEKLRPFVVVR
ncbi:MAG: helix-hairpin-helix domain-containing protein [Gemmataceae bacterium]|nr:helix-hairpin-helix domain-containing protein [Gemmata sp.]MDW8198355.1 helix-hairpin-helix domain-containing protein [Gemmataceae bacterium]